MSSKTHSHALVVEDDAFLAGMIGNALRENGVSVTIVGDGAAAIKALDTGTHAVSVVVLDLLLPHVDGFRVLEHIAGMKGKKPPVVVLTNLSDAQNRARCKKLGCSAFIVKSDIDAQSIWPALQKYAA